MDTKREIIPGDFFGYWTVVSGPHKIPSKGGNKGALYLKYECVCRCGKLASVRRSSLLRESSKSCGCMPRKERNPGRAAGHNRRGRRSRQYNIWQAMKQRCINKSCPEYGLYGGRGISLCDEWMEFLGFLKWCESSGYEDGKSVDRIDFNGNYTPDNCRWSTNAEQARNKRNNILLEARGEVLCVTDWANHPEATVSVNGIKRRIKVLGMSPEEAIFSPRRGRWAEKSPTQ